MKTIKMLVLMTMIFAAFALCGGVGAVVTDDPAENGGDARLLGMGRAYTAISDDPNAVFFNPAGLSGVKAFEVNGMYYSKMFNTYNVFTGSGALPTPWGTFGMGYVGSGVSGIYDTRDPNDIGEFGSSDNVFVMSYGSSMGRFVSGWQRIYFGASTKFFTRGYSEPVGETGTGFNMDLGLKYVPVQWLSLGVSRSNILPSGAGGGITWTTGNYEALNSLTRLGAALRFDENRAVLGLDAKVPSKSEEPVLFSVGGEYGLQKFLFLRAGLSQNIDAAKDSRTNFDPSLGVGFMYENFKVDYAYRPYFSDSANATHYISISFNQDVSDLFKIRLVKIDNEKLKQQGLYLLPGKVYDDLGNVVKGAESYYHSGVYWSPHLSALNSYVPVTAQIVDYDTAVAMAFSDIKAMREEQSPRRYFQGDIIPVIVEAPYDIETIVAVMPNGDQVKLLYDEKADAWYGIWKVPKGTKDGLFRARIIATDFEGVKITSTSTPFFLGRSTASTPEVPAVAKEVAPAETVKQPQVEVKKEAEVQTAPNVVDELKLKAEAKAKAEEQARLEAQKEAELKAKLEEQARLEAEKRAQEQAKLEAQRKAEDAAKLTAEERAKNEAEMKARLEEQARLEAGKRAQEQAKLEAQRKVEEAAKVETPKKVAEVTQPSPPLPPPMPTPMPAPLPPPSGGPVEEQVIGINVLSPDDKTVSYKDVIQVKGVAGKEIKKLLINGESAYIGTGGKFLAKLPLTLGKNTIVLEGEAVSGGNAKVVRRVLRLAMPSDATEAEINAIKNKAPEERAILTIASESLNRPLGLYYKITRAESSVILVDIKGLTVLPLTVKPFKDVELNSWASRHIGALKDAKLVGGYPGATFRPIRRITLAEFAAIVLRSEGISHTKPYDGKSYWALGVISKVKEMSLLKDAQSFTVDDFKRSIDTEKAVELLSKTRSGAEKAQYLLDWERGY
jgi:hypothetical protein